MNPQTTQLKRRWPRRVAFGVIAAVLAAASVPFIFTTSLVRYALAHSDYARFSPTISRASLSPAGKLRIENLALHDSGAAAGRPLLTVGHLNITFGWGDVWSSRVQQVRAEDTTLYVRPGTEKPVSLLELANPSGTPAASAKPLWMDRLACRGSVEVEPVAGLTVPTRSWPLTLSLVMHGPRETPRRKVEAMLGRDGGAVIQTRLETSEVAGEPLVQIDQFEGRVISLAVEAELLRRLAPTLPEPWQRKLSIQLGNGALAGVMENRGGTLRFRGDVKLRDVTSSMAGEAEVRHANIAAAVETPLAAGAAQELRVSQAHLDAQEITWGRWRVAGLDIAGNLAGSNLVVDKFQGRLADSGFHGKFTYNLTKGFASLAGEVGATRMDAAAVLAEYFPKEITGIDRFVDVTARLGRDAQGQRVGNVEIAASPAADETDHQPSPAKVAVAFRELPDQAVQIDRAVAENWNLAAPAELLRRWAGPLPQVVDERLAREGPVRIVLGKLEAAGRLDYGPIRRFTGTVTATALGIAAPLAVGDQAGLENVKFTAQVDLPLSAGGKPVGISQCEAAIGRIAYGQHQAENITLAGAFTPERVTADHISVSLGDGTLSGHLTFDLATQAIPACDLTFRDLDAGNILPWPVPPWLASMTRYDGRIIAKLDPGEPIGSMRELPNCRSGSIELDIAAAGESPITLPEDPATTPATQPARRLILRAQGDGHGRITLQEFSLRNLYVVVPADQIKDWGRQYGFDPPEILAVNWTTSLDTLYLAGVFDLRSQKNFSGTAEIKAFSLSTPPDAKTVVDVARVNTRADLKLPIGADWLKTLSATQGRFSLDRAAVGPSQTEHLFTRWNISHGALSLDSTIIHLAGGTLTGKAQLIMDTLAMPVCDFTVTQIDVHEVLKNIIPERLDATGLFSGTIRLERGPGKAGEFNGSIDLTATTPGILKVGDIPKLKETLAAAQGADIAALAMEDLRNYPFQYGKITIESRGPDTLVKPTFQRDLNAPATPVQPRTIVIAGQPKVLATAKIATISSPEVLLTGISLQKILAMASGLSPYFEVLKQGLERGKTP